MTYQVLDWLISSCVLILVVLALRGLLGQKISARLRYALWALVLLRLLVLVPLFSSPMPGARLSQWTLPLREESVYLLPIQSVPYTEDALNPLDVPKEDVSAFDANSFGYAVAEVGEEGGTVTRYAARVSLFTILKWLWVLGSAGMGLVLLVCNLRFGVRLRRIRRPLAGTNAPIPVYTARGLPSPCLLGLFRPAVYVTEVAAENPVMLRHVLAHELTHYRHRDHLWSSLRCAALAIHWWNPLVWAAAVFSRRDGELACDEGALKRLGDNERAAYGETLLELVSAKARPGDLLQCATTMTGEKRRLRERVRRIACKQKQLVSATAAVIFVLGAAAFCTFGRAENSSAEMESLISEAGDSWWKTTRISVDEMGIPHLHAAGSDKEWDWTGEPVPAPREWADQDGVAGRSEASSLSADGLETWARLVSPEEGWLVACCGRGVAAADTYVYKTSDGGRTWEEVSMPGTSWHIADVGFLSADRLIVAQRLFNGAPVFITKDGGESWEQVNLPWVGAQVSSIYVSGDCVQMLLSGDEDSTWTLTSDDLGDTWIHWSNAALDRVLSEMTADDIQGIDGQSEVTAAELAELLRETSPHRSDRFILDDRFEQAETWIWCDAEWSVPLKQGATLHLAASNRNRSDVVIGRETAGGVEHAIYTSPELHALVSAVGEPYPFETLPYTPDLNHDGKPDKLNLRTGPDGMSWCIQCLAESGGTVYPWEAWACTAHVGWNALFLCRLDGEDYLLRYQPYMSSGECTYQYRLFYLQQGMPVCVQENSVSFDLVFAPEFADSHTFDPEAIAAFMEEVNVLLENSTQLLNTDSNLLDTFEKEGRLYDSIWWLDERDKSKTILENLIAYEENALQVSR